MNNLNKNYEEKLLKAKRGMPRLFILLLLSLASLGLIIAGGVFSENEKMAIFSAVTIVTGFIFLFLVLPVLSIGFKIIGPNEARVLVLFGKYHGTLAKEGFFWVNPFCTSVNPTQKTSTDVATGIVSATSKTEKMQYVPKKISLKAMTLNNGKQKVNDLEGNPIEIGVIVIWRIVNTAKAVFNVDNYITFLSNQADSAIRQVARLYPYDINSEGDEKSLRGSSQEIADMLKSELQNRVDIAGIEVMEARISHLAYSTEIAAVMLQRQQASAIIAARQKIVEGAVGMVEMALNKLSENGIVKLDEERKAAMVSNLLVVLCGNKDAQPIVNSGTIY